MKFWWCLETWCGLANLLFVKIQNCAPHYLHEMPKFWMWQFCILHGPGLAEVSKFPKVYKNYNFDCYFVEPLFLMWDWWCPNKLCMIGEPHNNFVHFELCKNAIPVSMEIEVARIRMSSKIPFFRFLRLLFKLFHELIF